MIEKTLLNVWVAVALVLSKKSSVGKSRGSLTAVAFLSSYG